MNSWHPLASQSLAFTPAGLLCLGGAGEASPGGFLQRGGSSVLYIGSSCPRFLYAALLLKHKLIHQMNQPASIQETSRSPYFKQ